MIHTHVLEATSVAVAWTFQSAEDCVLERIALKFDAAPTTAENITVKVNCADGVEYAHTLATHDPSTAGETEVVITPSAPLKYGDTVTVAYPNTDTNEIVGIAYNRLL